MKTNNSGFNSTYLLVSEERWEGERRERQRTRIKVQLAFKNVFR